MPITYSEGIKCPCNFNGTRSLALQGKGRWMMISDNSLRLSHRTIPTSNFEIIQHLHLLEDVVFWRKKLLGRSQHSPLWTTTTCKSIQFNFCCILSYLLTGKGMGNFAGKELRGDESMKWWYCGDEWWPIIYSETQWRKLWGELDCVGACLCNFALLLLFALGGCMNK
jgi:hypothetical protein